MSLAAASPRRDSAKFSLGESLPPFEFLGHGTIAIRKHMNHMRSNLLQGTGENAERLLKSASGTAKYTLHQRVMAHALGFGPDYMAAQLMSVFWSSEWPREWELMHRVPVGSEPMPWQMLVAR